MAKLTTEAVEYIVARIIENANEAASESRADKTDNFKDGRAMAYYEVLDIIKSELEVREQDLKRYGLDINLEKEML